MNTVRPAEWKILLIDQNPADYTAMRALFQETRGEAVELLFQLGKKIDAQAIAENRLGVDLVLAECPLDPATVAEAIQELEQRCPGLPVILVTDWLEGEIETMSRLFGRHGFLARCCLDGERLCGKIEEVLGQREKNKGRKTV